MAGLGEVNAPELDIDDKVQRNFVNWFKALPEVCFYLGMALALLQDTLSPGIRSIG